MRGLWVCTLLCSLLIACDEDMTSGAHDTAGLTIALKGSDSRGQSYRLRSADFTIYGCPEQQPGGTPTSCSTTSVSSDADLESDFIAQRLLPGSYNVTLGGDWYLEELRGDEAERVEQAVLLSSPWQDVYVWDGSSQTIFFSFGVNGDIIDFRHGDLNIGILVQTPADHDCGGAGGFSGSCNQAGSAGSAVAGSGADSDAGASNP